MTISFQPCIYNAKYDVFKLAIHASPSHMVHRWSRTEMHYLSCQCGSIFSLSILGWIEYWVSAVLHFIFSLIIHKGNRNVSLIFRSRGRRACQFGGVTTIQLNMNDKSLPRCYKLSNNNNSFWNDKWEQYILFQVLHWLLPYELGYFSRDEEMLLFNIL